jgi:hypothetical protein
MPLLPVEVLKASIVYTVCSEDSGLKRHPQANSHGHVDDSNSNSYPFASNDPIRSGTETGLLAFPLKAS